MSEDIKWLSITAIEKATKIPATTIRRYLTNHGHHFLTKNDGKMVLVAEASTILFNQIRDSYKAGLQKDEIEIELEKQKQTSITTVIDDNQWVYKKKEETMEEMNKTINELREKVEKQKELLSEVIRMMGRASKEKDDEIKHLHQKIDHLLAEMTIMREELEARKQVAATKREKRLWFKHTF